MFQFPRFASRYGMTEFTSVRFPHSGIPGSKPACGSPRLIAACHALHRSPVPRHPPHALSRLIPIFPRRLTPAFPVGKGWPASTPHTLSLQNHTRLTFSCQTATPQPGPDPRTLAAPRPADLDHSKRRAAAPGRLRPADVPIVLSGRRSKSQPTNRVFSYS